MNWAKSTRGRACAGLFATFATFGAWACTPVNATDTYIGPGVYCLQSDLIVSRNPALTLIGNSVLDCQGHRIKDATSTSPWGVMIMGQGDNVVLKNCVFEGFAFPVYSVSITNLRILNNTFLGTRSIAILGADMEGLIKGNTFNISGSGGEITAINTSGVVDIIGNTIVNEQAPPEAIHYQASGILASGNGGVISNNIIRNLRAASTGYGIAISSQTASVISGNVVVNPPGTGDTGISCNGQAKAVANLVTGFATPYVACLP
jgi:hypothetical protein